ncbi:MAG: hypothetical protein EBT30_06085, partial [Verrucomicrobia bacterium]|nr:hypothetical protein [Verrucomicrobiota bacterium]
MKHRVCCVGRPGGWAREAGQEYSKRIGRFGELQCIHLREGPNVEKQMMDQGQGWWKICLDPQGKSQRTADWKKEWEQW